MTSPHPCQLTVICPFYNEQAVICQAILKLVNTLNQSFPKNSWELILVNDGSNDESYRRAQACITELPGSPSIHLLTYPHNHGRGYALKMGIDHAHGEIIVTLEIDGTWGNDIIYRLTQTLQQSPDHHFIIASPHLSGGGLVNVPWQRRFLSRWGNHLIALCFGSAVTMNTGMTRAYLRGVIQPLRTHCHGKEFHLEVLLKLLNLGFQCKEIPATITWQPHQSSKFLAKRTSSTKIFKTIVSHLQFLAIAQPIRYFALFALVSALLGFGLIGTAVWMLLTHKPAVFFAIIGLIMLLFCLLFAAFSVLFFQFREFMRERWLQGYQNAKPHHPSQTD